MVAKTNQHLKRRDFIRIASLTGFSLYFDVSNSKSSIEEKKFTTNSSTSEHFSIEPIIEHQEKTSDEHVRFIKKEDLDYDRLRQGHNKRIEKYPALIALCFDSLGVKEALLLARKNKWPVAIKSSGHSLDGFSCNDGGMVIDLTQINSIKWLDDHQLSLGPACNLAQLNNELLPKGRLLPGGSCGTVAIGGLTLGGGYGMYSRKYGLTCDSLLEVEMVDGQGRIVNSRDDPELLWACKGGGSGNFGVITQLKFRTYPAPRFLSSHRFRKFKTNASMAKELLGKWFELSQQLPHSCFSVFVLNGKTVFILLTNFGKESAEVKNFITQLTSLSDKVTSSNQQELSTAVKTFYGAQESLFSKNSSVGLYQSFDDVRAFIEPVFEKISSTPGMLFSIGTLGGKITSSELEKNSAFAHRSYTFLSELQTYWNKKERRNKMMSAYEEVRDLFQNNGISRQYINYPDSGFKNWEQAYYGENYERLQDLKSKYDPDNVVQHPQSVQLKKR